MIVISSSPPPGLGRLSALLRSGGLGRSAPRAAVLLALGLLSACGGGGTGGAGGGPPVDPQFTTLKAKAALRALPPAFRKADLANGELEFNLCRSCHTVVRGGANMTGPNLYGVFGRMSGTHPGFAYSEALLRLHQAWGAETLDRWIRDPRAVAPGTKMSFPGLKDATDRRDLIAYLKLASSGALD